MKAFITGVTGQDGHYLSELLISKGYEVYGLVRKTSQYGLIPKGVKVVVGDVSDPSTTNKVIDVNPDEIYHLAAIGLSSLSSASTKETFDVNAVGTLNVLESAKALGCKFFNASTSEIFSVLKPRNSYVTSKFEAHSLSSSYRESQGLYACNGILYNHESPVRSKDFVTRKITSYVANIIRWEKNGYKEWEQPGKLLLGNIDAVRDWGHAKDYVRAMWIIMQQKEPGDYAIATGLGYSVRHLLEEAFSYTESKSWALFVEIDEVLYRPSEDKLLIGDPSKIESLGWKREYTFKSLIKEMIGKELE